MAFVQITRTRGVANDKYETIRRQATGGKLLDGELFFVDGQHGDELWIVDGWKTREQCDRAAMDAWGPAMAAAGVSMDDITTEEFEIDELHLGSPEHP
jgi:hypothetical protein